MNKISLDNEKTKSVLSFLEVLSNKNRYAKLTIGNKVIRDKFKFVIALRLGCLLFKIKNFKNKI